MYIRFILFTWTKKFFAPTYHIDTMFLPVFSEEKCSQFGLSLSYKHFKETFSEYSARYMDWSLYEVSKYRLNSLTTESSRKVKRHKMSVLSQPSLAHATPRNK